MTWKGKWKNQYGSIVDITDDTNRRINGTFRTALKDSGFYGQEIPVVGIHQGDCISFVAGGETAAGDAAVSYTGLLRGQGGNAVVCRRRQCNQGVRRRRAWQKGKAELVAFHQHQRRYV
jgi:hypothetical protein